MYMSATGLSQALMAVKVSSVELTESAIARIIRYDEQINAVCVPTFETARAAAHDADVARSRGDRRPLLGIPMTVKESFNMAGLPTTWGIPSFKDYKATEDAVAVARLKAAGAVILGKTNVPLALGDLQSYNEIYGTTRNPWNLDLTPGGSSGGSAAALAAGYGALSIGSDIAGSLRIPAHHCGVYAHKPSFGLLPARGHVPPPNRPLPHNRDLSVIGPMARSATDLALMLEILCPPDEMSLGAAYSLALRPPRHDKLADYRVLLVDTHPLIPTASSIRAALAAFADQLDRAGIAVERNSSLLPDLTNAARIYMRLLMSTFSVGMPAQVYDRAQERAAKLDPDDQSLAAERVRGSALSHRDWLIADNARAYLREQWRILFSQFDVVVCPVAPVPAFPHDHSPDQWRRQIVIDGSSYDYADQLVWAGIATAPGLPATVAPISRSGEGIPIGMQIIGPMFEDLTPIRFAELVEQEFGGFTAPPLDWAGDLR
jgi:amidase